jgi:hypothetical protein
MARSAAPSAPDPALICGLIVEFGEQARAVTYDRSWERDAATWGAVREALDAAEAGQRPGAAVAHPPSWLARIVRERLETLARRTAWVAAFEDVRKLERLGAVDLPVDDTYVLAAVGGLGDWSAGSRAQALRADPALIERVVWRMFEVEGGGEVSLANVDKYNAREASWQSAFIELIADGTLDRERVLTSALAALNRDFSAYRAGWYARLYDALSPALDELERHQPLLRALLRSDINATVTFAVTKLRQLSKQARLDDAAAIAALRPAVLASAKGTAVTALRLVAEAVRRSPGTWGQAVETAAAGLQHPHADVQRAAAALLSDLHAGDVVTRASDDLEPSVRQSLGLAAPARVEDGPASRPPVTPVQSMPERAGRHDLLDRTAAVLEDASDAAELEAVLAGLAALADPQVLGPLTKRADAVLRRGPREDVLPGWLRGQLARLVLLAAGRSPSALPVPTPHLAFLLRRLDDVAAVLTGARPPTVLLATPTDPGGWLDPSSLVGRLCDAGPSITRHDLIAAVLRLHADGRDAALQQLRACDPALDPDVAPAVAYALGVDPPTAARRRLRRSPAIGDRALWVAAGRARGPLVEDPWLAQQGLVGAGRSLPLEAAVELTARPYSWTDPHEADVTHSAVAWEWRIAVAGRSGRPGDDEPTCPGPDQQDRLLEQRAEDFTSWTAMTFPHDAEHFLLDSVHAVLDVAAYDEVNHDAVRVLDALGAHPGRLGRLSTTALAAGLTASKADQRARAVDAVQALHQQGRLSAADLGEGLRHLVGPAKLTRWATSLRDLAATNRAGGLLVRGALAAALPAIDSGTRGVHALTELLHEELLQAEAPTPAELRPWLSQFAGSSRAAKAAALLLKRV